MQISLRTRRGHAIRLIFCLLFLDGCSASASSPAATNTQGASCWSTISGNLIDTCSGNVGIGTSSPTYGVSVTTVLGDVAGNKGATSSKVSYAPTSSGSGIVIGSLGQVTYEGAGIDVSGAGHLVGALGHSVANTSGRSVGLMIGTEGKIDVTAGTVSSAISAENQLASNSGFIAQWIGTNNHIVSNSQPLPLVYGSNLQIANNASSITTAASVVLSNPTSNTGTITNLIGLYVPNISSTGVTNKFSILSQDSSAVLYQTGPSVLMGNVGIGTASPQASVDINGTLRLSANSSQPYACSSGTDANIARTSRYTLCICKGSSSAWVSTNDGSTTCVW